MRFSQPEGSPSFFDVDHTRSAAVCQVPRADFSDAKGEFSVEDRHFFAYMSRMKHIKRWALMRNTWQEDIAQHSLQVSMIAHALALLRNRRFGGGADPERAALLALYHEAPEVITGDLATPIKYFNPGIRSAYKEIEGIAAKKLHSMLPEDLQGDYAHPAPDPGERSRVAARQGRGQDRRLHQVRGRTARGQRRVRARGRVHPRPDRGAGPARGAGVSLGVPALLPPDDGRAELRRAP